MYLWLLLYNNYPYENNNKINEDSIKLVTIFAVATKKRVSSYLKFQTSASGTWVTWLSKIYYHNNIIPGPLLQDPNLSWHFHIFPRASLSLERSIFTMMASEIGRCRGQTWMTVARTDVALSPWTHKHKNVNQPPVTVVYYRLSRR